VIEFQSSSSARSRSFTPEESQVNPALPATWQSREKERDGERQRERERGAMTRRYVTRRCESTDKQRCARTFPSSRTGLGKNYRFSGEGRAKRSKRMNAHTHARTYARTHTAEGRFHGTSVWQETSNLSLGCLILAQRETTTEIYI